MSTDLQEITDLISKAGTKCGSEYKLSKALGIPQHHISAWKAGTRTCTPEDMARLAGFAGENALQWLVRGVLSKNAGTLKGEQLQAVLGKWSHQTGGAIVTVLAAISSSIFGLMHLGGDIPLCILC